MRPATTTTTKINVEHEISAPGLRNIKKRQRFQKLFEMKRVKKPTLLCYFIRFLFSL